MLKLSLGSLFVWQFVKSLVSQWVSTSPIELFWTAKKIWAVPLILQFWKYEKLYLHFLHYLANNCERTISSYELIRRVRRRRSKEMREHMSSQCATPFICTVFDSFSFTCVSDSEFRGRSIYTLKTYPFRILSALKTLKTHARTSSSPQPLFVKLELCRLCTTMPNPICVTSNAIHYDKLV